MWWHLPPDIGMYPLIVDVVIVVNDVAVVVVDCDVEADYEMQLLSSLSNYYNDHDHEDAYACAVVVVADATDVAVVGYEANVVAVLGIDVFAEDYGYWRCLLNCTG